VACGQGLELFFLTYKGVCGEIQRVPSLGLECSLWVLGQSFACSVLGLCYLGIQEGKIQRRLLL
jgi:hypothetical protein